MSRLSIPKRTIDFWDQEPTFRKDVSDNDAYIIKQIAHAMLSSLYPSSSTWKVVYLPSSYVIGCEVPKDVKITSDHLQSGVNIHPKKVLGSWVEWNGTGFNMCCKITKKVIPYQGVKRSRDD